VFNYILIILQKIQLGVNDERSNISISVKAKKVPHQRKSAADRSPQNISEILNRKSSPTLDSFTHLINTCDEIAPGFADDFYGSLASERLNLTQFVNSLDSVELGMLLVVAGQRIQEKQMMAIAS
jgi:hypothetical protein